MSCLFPFTSLCRGSFHFLIGTCGWILSTIILCYKIGLNIFYTAWSHILTPFNCAEGVHSISENPLKCAAQLQFKFPLRGNMSIKQHICTHNVHGDLNQALKDFVWFQFKNYSSFPPQCNHIPLLLLPMEFLGYLSTMCNGTWCRNAAANASFTRYINSAWQSIGKTQESKLQQQYGAPPQRYSYANMPSSSVSLTHPQSLM